MPLFPRLPLAATFFSVLLACNRASRLPTGRRQHKPVYIQARIDRSTPQFFNALANNETITDLKLQFWRPERTGKEVLAYTMEFVNASVAEITISTDEMQRPSVSIGFTYEKIIWTWTLDSIAKLDVPRHDETARPPPGHPVDQLRSVSCVAMTPQRIVLLTHERELMKPTNTSRVVLEAFGHNATRILWRRATPEPELLRMIEAGGVVLVWPLATRGVVAPVRNPHTYVVIDGTRQQARKIYNRSPYLHALPTIALRPAEPSSYTLRR